MQADWHNWLIGNEGGVRLACFLAVLGVCLLAERLWPRRPASGSGQRLWSNLGVVAINTLLLRLLIPVLAVGMALLAEQRQWGLFVWLDLPVWLEVLIAVLLLDMIIYWQHRLFHALPWLWRLHRMHHSDIHIDASTGLRFHPGEILLSMLIKLVAVAALGAAPLAVLIFEVLLNAGSLFNHSNLRLPVPLDHWLRRVIVTPDMHRVHHSWHRHEHDSNFGFSFPWWDRLFRSYRAQPEEGHLDMTIGLHDFRDAQRLDQLLLQPLQPATHEPTVRRRIT